MGHGRGNHLRLTHEIRFPHSLGLLYSAFTYYTGFRVNSGEYKVMGLAPYGEPRYADLIKKHCDSYGMTIGRGRARTAPQLSSIRGDRQGGEQDAWQESETGVTRARLKPRRELFTPRRVSGAPPCKALTPQRVTRGRYLQSGQEFVHTDTWTSRAEAHRDLGAQWVGATEIYSRSSWKGERTKC